MPHDSATQLARGPLLLLDYAEHKGLDRAELMRQAGIRPREVQDPDSRIRTASMRRLWRAVDQQLDDPNLGLHIGMTIKATQLGLVGYAMAYSETLRDAVNRLIRYFRILSEAVQHELREDDNTATLVTSADPSLIALRHPIDVGLTMMMCIAREVTQTQLSPIKVEMPYAAPAEPTPMEYRAFFGCTVQFGRPYEAMTFTREQMSLPNQLADPTLTSYLDELACVKLDTLGKDGRGLVNELREALWTMLPGGRPDLWRAAQDLGISARTLQRRLGEEGTSFSRVLDELRRDLADELLTDQKLSVSEVAFLLGYSEPSAFQRAFRRWRGVSPRRFKTGSDG